MQRTVIFRSLPKLESFEPTGSADAQKQEDPTMQRFPRLPWVAAAIALAGLAPVFAGTTGPFSDRQLIIDTALADDASASAAADAQLADATDALADAQAALDAAIAAGATQAELDALTVLRDAAQLELDAAIALVASFDAEAQAVADAVALLSDEQVVAINRSLNDSRHNGLVVDLDSAELLAILDGDYDARQIQALTKGLEEMARAEQLAARFEDQFARTGKEQFLDHADRALARGERQQEKFFAKIDRFEGNPGLAAARDSALADARHDARETAKLEARAAARAEARSVARAAAKEEALNAAKGRGRN